MCDKIVNFPICILADTNIYGLYNTAFFFLAVGNTFHFNWELSRSLFDASQVKEMTSQDGIWIVIVLYFHSLTSVNYRAIQYSDVRAFWREQSAPEVPLRAFYHIWRWMARLSRNDDVRGRCRAGPPRSSRTAWWWRHSDAAVAREEEEKYNDTLAA